MPKTKIVQIAFNKDPRKPEAIHYAMVDSDGAAWERYSDMEPGVWSEIQRPERPKPAKNGRRPRVTKPPL